MTDLDIQEIERMIGDTVDISEIVRRLTHCGYAINAAHDDERSRRQNMQITDEDSWHHHCKEAGEQFDRGELASRCGKPAILAGVHSRGAIFPYCAAHAGYDAGVLDKCRIWIRVKDEWFNDEDYSQMGTLVASVLKNNKADVMVPWEFLRNITAWNKLLAQCPRRG